MTTIQKDFSSKVRAYQTAGDRTIIDEIMQAVELDFMSNPTRGRHDDGITEAGVVSITLEKDEHYIAYRIRAMRELIMRKYEGRINDEYIHEINRLLTIVQLDLKIPVHAEIYKTDVWQYYYTLTPELFNDLEKRMPEIEEEMHYAEFQAFQRLFYRYKAIVDTRVVERVEAVPKIEQSIIASLEHGLKYVDTAKTPREMVKYINIAFRSKFSDLELERNGLTRIRRNDRFGEIQTLQVKKHFPADLTAVLLGESIKGYRDRLTTNQNDFVDEVMEIILADAISGNIDPYTCDKKGEARVSKSYLSDKLGLTPATTRKRISRILKRLA